MKLYRPHIPLMVRCRVAIRQLHDQLRPEDYLNCVAADYAGGRYGALLNSLLGRLAQKFGCEVSDLHLDHDPPLAARRRRGEGKRTVYIPDANDPNHLSYRPHGPQFEGSHLIKTNVRGDHGQYPDRVLIKREKRRNRGDVTKAKSTGFPKRRAKVKSVTSSGRCTFPTNKSAAKRKWPSRPMRWRWPKGRKITERI